MVVTDNFDCVQSAGPSVLSQFYLTERPNTNILHQLELIYALKIPFRADFYFCHIPFYIIMRTTGALHEGILTCRAPLEKIWLSWPPKSKKKLPIGGGGSEQMIGVIK